jgi:hypothetical protein
MRTTLYKLLKRFTDAGKLPEPIYEFGAYRTPGQESRGHVRDYFPSMRFVGCDMRPGPGVDEVQDLHCLNLPDNSIGTALLFDTIEHVREPWRAMAEIHRCLLPTGLIVMSSVMYFPIHAHPDDYWRFTGSGFFSLLQKFHVVCVESCGLKKLPHTVLGVASKEKLPPAMEGYLRDCVNLWKRHEANSWKENLMAVLPPVLLVPAYDLFTRMLETWNRGNHR